jgi:hypothetical protein
MMRQVKLNDSFLAVYFCYAYILNHNRTQLKSTIGIYITRLPTANCQLSTVNFKSKLHLPQLLIRLDDLIFQFFLEFDHFLH